MNEEIRSHKELKIPQQVRVHGRTESQILILKIETHLCNSTQIDVQMWMICLLGMYILSTFTPVEIEILS